MSQPPRHEPVEAVRARRDRALDRLLGTVPYVQLLGVGFDRRGDELTAVLRFGEHLIGNPMLPALHGGATASFLETAALVELSWTWLWDEMEAGRFADESAEMPRLPRTIDFTVDYLRTGLPRDAYARARVNRLGRRYASVHVEAWQDRRDRLFAAATGHFMMPQRSAS
jgi:acyl-coenzyme A thioesterase PaaI-like protein